MKAKVFPLVTFRYESSVLTILRNKLSFLADKNIVLQ